MSILSVGNETLHSLQSHMYVTQMQLEKTHSVSKDLLQGIARLASASPAAVIKSRADIQSDYSRGTTPAAQFVVYVMDNHHSIIYLN